MIILLSIFFRFNSVVNIIIPIPGTIIKDASCKNISDFKNSKWSKYFKNVYHGCGDANPNSPGFRKRYKTGWKATKSCDCKVQSNPCSGCLNC